MNARVKTSLISIVITTFLTLFKFLFYFLSGSVAILAEAWHSFSDIATSLFVLLAVRRPPEKKKAGLIKIHPELKISFVIGLFLLFVSLAIIRKTVLFKGPLISYPLVSGIIFIIFSFGSYFLYRFKTSVGRQEKSAALISDGLHSRADMVSSLLTGFSLIIYHLGINIDRFVGVFIALFILSFALETLVNVVSAHLKRKKEYAIEYRSYEIFALLFKRESYLKLIKLIDSKLKLRIAESKLYILFPRLIKWTFRILVAILVLAYFSTSFYTIKVDEEAIIERFGRVMSREVPIQPGLHLKLPWPVERIVKVNTKRIRELNLGNIVGTKLALLWTRPHGEEIDFVSGDNNFFRPYIVLHYKIKDPYTYLYNQVQPEMLLKSGCYRILTKTFTNRFFYDLALFSRKEWIAKSVEMIQKEIDELRSGIEIVNFLVKDLHPPRQIAGSFEEVIATYQEKQKLLNRATGYRNRQLSLARGNAFKEVTAASAYVLERTKKAVGESQNYLSRLSGYERSKGITKRNLYLKAMGKALKNNRKILIDPKVGIPDVWLKSEEFISTFGLGEH